MNTKDNVHKTIIELCEKIESILAKRIDTYGKNPRAHGENTLKGSELEASIDVIPQEDGIALHIADYWEYVARGWRRTGQSPNRGLYHALVLWALRKHIILDGMTANESAVRVAEITWFNMIIKERPIKARPFMRYDKEGDLEKMIPELKAYMEKWFDSLFDKIMNEVDKFFN